MPNLSQEQLQNAALIYRVGREMGLGTRDIQIGLITAMQESSLQNLNHGDRDSLGLFQQRPSQGWGSATQVTNPEYAARKFFTELKKLGESRYDMTMTEAAQAVQRSAYPDAYAKHIGLIRSIYPEISQQRPMDARGPQVPDISANPAAPPSTSDYLEGTLAAGPGTLLGAQGYNPLLSPGYGTPTEEMPWSSILSPATAEMLMDRDAAGDIELGYGKGLDGWRKAVVREARKYVGDPYVWGGSSPGGFDCSGLLQYVFGRAGIELPRVSYQQANYGSRIGLKGLRPGDLVAWDNSSRNNGADHIALYIGNNQIIEAPRPGLGVRVRSLGDNEGAWGVRIDK